MRELYVYFNVDDLEYREVIYLCSEWGAILSCKAGHAYLYMPSKYVKGIRRKKKAKKVH